MQNKFSLKAIITFDASIYSQGRVWILQLYFNRKIITNKCMKKIARKSKLTIGFVYCYNIIIEYVGYIILLDFNIK